MTYLHGEWYDLVALTAPIALAWIAVTYIKCKYR